MDFILSWSDGFLCHFFTSTYDKFNIDLFKKIRVLRYVFCSDNQWPQAVIGPLYLGIPLPLQNPMCRWSQSMSGKKVAALAGGWAC